MYSRTLYRRFKAHEQDIYSIIFGTDNDTMFTGSSDGTVRQWSLRLDRNLRVLTIGDGVSSLALSPDGRFLVAGSFDKSICIWNTSTWRLVEHSPDGDTEPSHSDAIYSVVFSPDGKTLSSASLDSSVAIWALDYTTSSFVNKMGTSQPEDVVSRKQLLRLKGHKDFVLSLAMVNGGRQLLSASKDRSVLLWDAHTGAPIALLKGHQNSVISIASSHDQKYFATASGDKTAKIWTLLG